MMDIRILRASGLSDAQILRVLETEQNERKLVRREQNRKNQQNHRARQQISTYAADSADSADPPQMSSPVPPPITTPPEDPEAKASALRAERERAYFTFGKQLLAKSSGGLLASLLKAKSQDVDAAMATLQLAATKADPREFVAAACRAPPRRGSGGGFAAVVEELRGQQNGHGGNETARFDEARTIDADEGFFGHAGVAPRRR